MTSQDFVFIAKTLNAITKDYLRSAKATDDDFDAEVADRVMPRIAEDFACALATTNPGFNKSKFLAACHVNTKGY